MPGSKWQFDLILDNIAIVTEGWDWWIDTSQRLSKESQIPGSTRLNKYPKDIVASVEVFRKLHDQEFDTRREALQALDGVLLAA